jgi:transcriptional regulator with XRE-family HTH domain
MGISNIHREIVMPKQKTEELTDFGKRLAKLRKTAGYTQTDLAKELGVTQRMISYYEGHTEYPPSSLLPVMVDVLNVTSDELLGIATLKKTRQPDTRLYRRIHQIDKMETSKKRQLLQIIDTFIEADQIKAKAC